MMIRNPLQNKKGRKQQEASPEKPMGLPTLPPTPPHRKRTTTPMRNRTSLNSVPRGREALKLISLNEAQWGGLILQRPWRWFEGKDPYSIGKLVQSFIQFSREIGEDGEISCVNFELPTQQHQKSKSSINYPYPLAMPPPPRPVQSMQMVCRRDSRVVVSCFYAVKNGQVTHCSTRDKVEEMLKLLHERFCTEFGEVLESMQEDFHVLGDGNGQPEEIDALQKNISDAFSSFLPIIDEVVDLYLYSDHH